MCLFNSLPAQNLVPNYSFEYITSCPNNGFQIGLAKPWFGPTTLFAEIFNSCDTNSGAGVPNNVWGNQTARTGLGYAGIYARVGAVSSDLRKYISVKLDTTLIAGVKYCITYYLNLSDSSGFGVSSIGVLFSKDSVKGTNGKNLPYTPQILNSASNFITDKVNWIKISGEYTSVGGEQFITIGNFANDVNTATKQATGSQQPYAYYYIDDVSVYQMVEANAGIDKQLCPGQSVAIGDSTLLNATYSWQPAIGLSDATAAMPKASPSVTTTYTLNIAYTGPNCTGKMADTATVFVDYCPNIYVPNIFSPNNDGKNDILSIDGSGIKNIYWGIYDRWGNLVFETYDQEHSWDGTKKGNPCNAGVYMYYLRGTFSDGKLVEQKGNVTLMR